MIFPSSLSPERKLVAIDGSLQTHPAVSSGLRGIPGAPSSDLSVSLASEEELTFSKIQSQLDVSIKYHHVHVHFAISSSGGLELIYLVMFMPHVISLSCMSFG